MKQLLSLYEVIIAARSQNEELLDTRFSIIDPIVEDSPNLIFAL